MKLIYASLATILTTIAQGHELGHYKHANEYNMWIGKACRLDRWGRDTGEYDTYKHVSLEWCMNECNDWWYCKGFEYNSSKEQCEIHTKYGGYFEKGTNKDLLCAWKE